MHGTTLSFANLHNHGGLFEKILLARRENCCGTKSIFDTVDSQDCDMYDTPQSRWLAVHSATGDLLANLRLTPTTAQCGVYSYMIRDAQRELDKRLPKNILYDEAPIADGLWEVTRGHLQCAMSPAERQDVLMQLSQQVLTTVRDEGIRRLLTLLPSDWGTWGASHNLHGTAAGPIFELDGTQFQAMWINTQDHLH